MCVRVVYKFNPFSTIYLDRYSPTLVSISLERCCFRGWEPVCL